MKGEEVSIVLKLYTPLWKDPLLTYPQWVDVFTLKIIILSYRSHVFQLAFSCGAVRVVHEFSTFPSHIFFIHHFSFLAFCSSGDVSVCGFLSIFHDDLCSSVYPSLLLLSLFFIFLKFLIIENGEGTFSFLPCYILVYSPPLYEIFLQYRRSSFLRPISWKGGRK